MDGRAAWKNRQFNNRAAKIGNPVFIIQRYRVTSELTQLIGIRDVQASRSKLGGDLKFDLPVDCWGFVRMQHSSGSDNLDSSHTARRIEILDLIPLEELQRLQDLLAKIHNVASVITDPDGNLLTLPSNEISICELIINSPQGLARCLEVSRSMTVEVEHSPRKICKPCNAMGILKTAIPIVIEDLHLADWWISQYCGPKPELEQIQKYADEIGMDAEMLLDGFDRMPLGKEKNFFSLIDSVESLTNRFASLLYQNFKLSHRLSDVHHLRNELGKQRARMEEVIQERTAELIKTNNRLQLEVMERDLAEEQIERKSRLLDAVNHILQQTLTDLSDHALANIFLHAARRLTSSTYGFIAEQHEGQWRVTTVHHPAGQTADQAPEPDPGELEIQEIWGRIRESGQPLTVFQGSRSMSWQPLSSSHPELKSLLAVPLSKKQQISGFVALADNQEGYAMIDQFDVELLTQAFIETLTRKRLEKAKSINEMRLNLALDSANEGLWDYAPMSEHVYYSPRWFSMLGYMTGEFPDTMETWNTLTHPDDLPTLVGTFDALVRKKNESFSIEIRMLSRTGQWLWLQVRGKTVDHDKAGNVLRIVGTLIDISKYKQVEVALQKANDELQRLAALDDLTQIANRRRFEDRLNQEWRRAQRDNTFLAVIICDIDYFKKYNDTYGHIQGDQALYAVAQAVNNALKRPMDLVARYGGEEFAMILPGTNIIGAERVAKEVKEAVDALNLEHMSSEISDHITLSFGVAAMVPKPDVASKILVETADRALYRAKDQGRNRILCVSTDNGETEKKSQPIAPPSAPELDNTPD